jgi:transcriptional regulator with XRE-family HTH domain
LGPVDSGVGERIALARKERGLTQEELAKGLGVTPRSVQGYEAGSVIPYRHFRRLAEITEREVSWFLHGTEDATPSSEVDEHLVALIEQVAAEAKRIADAAARLETVLTRLEAQSQAPTQPSPGSSARQ